LHEPGGTLKDLRNREISEIWLWYAGKIPVKFYETQQPLAPAHYGFQGIADIVVVIFIQGPFKERAMR
jgi:hypothetical protein